MVHARGRRAAILRRAGAALRGEDRAQAAETDETARFVHDLLTLLGEAGMMGANLPQDYGRSRISAPVLVRVVSTMSGASGSIASALTAHCLATDSNRRHRGAEAAMAGPGGHWQWASRLRFDRVHGRFRPADMRTRAPHTQNVWHLKGARCFISNDGVEDLIPDYSVIDPEKAPRSLLGQEGKGFRTACRSSDLRIMRTARVQRNPTHHHFR